LYTSAPIGLKESLNALLLKFLLKITFIFSISSVVYLGPVEKLRV